MNILIVDDEAAACANLTKKIKDLGVRAKIHSETDVLSALKYVKATPPDILFLDIQMPVMDGFAFLDQLPDRKFALIFCTAYSEYAVKAFEKSAIDYLLKPVEPERLQKALDRAPKKKRVDLTSLTGLAENQYLERIYAKAGGHPTIVSVADVSFFSSEAHETVIFVRDRELICDLSLDHLEERLNPGKFFRCHRSKIVNLAQVSSFHKENSELLLNGSKQEVPVSKRSRADLIKRLKA